MAKRPRSGVRRSEVVRARRDDDCAVALGPELHVIAGRRRGRLPVERAIGPRGNVLEQIHRLWHRDGAEAQRGQRGLEVAGARCMAGRSAEARVARGIAGREEHVVEARRGIRLEEQDRLPAIAHERFADAREEPEVLGARVLGTQVLPEVVETEREQIAHLPAVQIHHSEAAPRLDPHGPPLARGNVDAVFGHTVS